MNRVLVVGVILVGTASCPDDPPDARAFITAVFQASTICQPTFLAEAEPVFLNAQSQAQINVAIDTFHRDLANPNVTFSRDEFDACLQAANDDDCDVINDNSGNGACSLVFVGKLGESAVCAEGIECGPDFDCFQDPGACGTCTKIAQEGTDCSDRNCAGGDFCSEQDVCEPKPAPASFKAGDVCNLGTGCGGVLSGLVCKDSLCVKMHVVDEGAPCDIGLSAVQYCRDSSTTHACIDGVCSKRPGVGESCAGGQCDATVGACLVLHKGDSPIEIERCEDVGDAGDGCEDGTQCKLGLACKEAHCVPLTATATPPHCN